MQFKQKPLTLVCYVCGREFGTRSLEIHMKSCLEKFAIEQNKKEKKDRLTLPPEPQLLKTILQGNLEELERFNEQSLKLYKYKVLPSCKYCGRTFNEGSLKVHENVCNKKSSAPIEKSKKEETYGEEVIKKPRTLVCCVCGREFGLFSLKIHYPQCLQKFKIEEKKKDKVQRKQAPTFTEEELQLINNKEDWTLEQIEKFNLKASSCFKDKGMVHCANCKRSFMPEPYKRHLKNCELINGKNVQAEEKKKHLDIYEEQPQIKKPKVLMCHICGREFGLSSLIIHQKACRTKFLNNQKQKPKSQRKPLPCMPEDIALRFNFENVDKWTNPQIEEYNGIANTVYRNDSMYECPFCHRKFIEASFQKHRKYCEKNSQKEQRKEDNGEALFIRDKSRAKKQQVSPQKKAQKQKSQADSSRSMSRQNMRNQVNSPKKNQSNTKKPENISKVPQSKIPVKEVINEMPEQLESTTKKNQQDQIPQQSPQNLWPHKPQQFTQSNEFILPQIQKPEKKESPKQQIKNKSVIKKAEQPSKQQKARQQQKIQAQQAEKKNAFEDQSIVLQPCGKCGRKFLVDRLPKHEGICKGTLNQQQMPIPSKKVEKKQQIKRQEPVVEKPKTEISKQDKSQQKSESREQTDNKNDEFPAMGHSKMLVPCKKCGRRFLQNRLQKHEECCKGKVTKSQQENLKSIDTAKQTIESSKPVRFNRLQEKSVDPIVKESVNKNQQPKERKKAVQANENVADLPAQEQVQDMEPTDLKPCSKCNRKFKQDRLQFHENVCKGPSNLNKRSSKGFVKQQDSKNMEAIRKTKQNFFKMVQDLKGKKVKEEDIDMQIQNQLETFDKNEPHTGRVLKKKRNNDQKDSQGDRETLMIRQKNEDIQYQSVAKWNSNTKKLDKLLPPKVSNSKGSRFTDHLPQI